MDQQLAEFAQMHCCSEREKCVLLITDEMHIKEDIIYNKLTGILLVQFVSFMCYKLYRYHNRAH